MRRWKEIQPDLDARGIRIVTLCTDTPRKIRRGMGKHGLDAVMLSDADLTLTRRLGLENTAIKVKPPGVPGLPIPTTILVDADGIVRWIDQADDYQVRSEPERVHEAVHMALASG